jgi:hypothetical protein
MNGFIFLVLIFYMSIIRSRQPRVYDAEKSGSRIGLRSISDDGKEVIFRDFFWTRRDYKTAANEADLELLEEHIPRGLETDGKDWKEDDKQGAYHIQVKSYSKYAINNYEMEAHIF